MALAALLIVYCGIVAVGLVLCAAAFLADPAPRCLAEILGIAVPLVLLWPFILVGALALAILRMIRAAERRLSAR